MKVVIAIDSFKGSLTSLEAGNAAKAGVLRALPDASVTVSPLADGGEGTAAALTEALCGQTVSVRVTGPLGAPVTASYGILPDGRTAVMEMAQAAGITLIPPGAADPLRASTFGVGEMLADAYDRGCRAFIMGIGGSATVDGGTGMLSALGVRFLDEAAKPLAGCLASLDRIAVIDVRNAHPLLKECRFDVACDVKNPLTGKDGAVAVFGPQKGVKDEEKAPFDAKMRHFADKTAAFLGKDERDTPGAGAAGGLGYALLAYFAYARLCPGAELVMKTVKLEEAISGADVVVTGEGRLDAQSAMGKAPIGVARLAKAYGKRVLAFAGCVSKDAAVCNDAGIDAYFPVLRGVTTLEEAMKPENARENLADTVEQVFRLFRR